MKGLMQPRLTWQRAERLPCSMTPSLAWTLNHSTSCPCLCSLRRSSLRRYAASGLCPATVSITSRAGVSPRACSRYTFHHIHRSTSRIASACMFDDYVMLLTGGMSHLELLSTACRLPGSAREGPSSKHRTHMLRLLPLLHPAVWQRPALLLWLMQLSSWTQLRWQSIRHWTQSRPSCACSWTAPRSQS